MRRSASAPRARLLRALVCLSLLAHTLLPVRAGTGAHGTGKTTAPVGKMSARQEVEAADLPNLDEADRRPRHEPKAVPPVPSMRRRCPPRNPRCNDGETAAPQATAPKPAQAGRGGPFSVTSAAPYQSQSGRVNVALAANGGSASASSTFNQPPDWVYSAAGTIDGNRRGSSLGGGQWSGWNDDAPGNTFPDWLQVNFNGHKSIDEIDLFTQQDNYANPSEPTETMTFSQYGLSGFVVEYWTGTAWATVPGGSVSGNDKVWRKLTFPAVTTDKIRVLTNTSADGYSRVTELEAWGVAARLNLALAANGGVASASSSFNYAPFFFTPAGANDGDRKGLNWGSGGGWNDDAPGNTFPDWLQIDFPGPRSIDEVDVFTGQDNWSTPSEPTEAMTFSQYGLTGFVVEYWTGTVWATVPGGSVSGNDKVWRKFTFPALTTSKIRVLTQTSNDGYSRLTEVEAYEADASQDASGTGLTGEYYDGVNFDTYRLTRTDASVNFDWAANSPHSSVGSDNFSVRWTGTVVPRYTESYTFHATTDDGVRLWIDGQLVIDRWQDQAPTEVNTTTLALEAGRHYAVRMEFYERAGGALAWLKWSSASQAKEIVPQARLYGGGAVYNFTNARLDPVNRTGGGGVDAYSRNFNFQIPLVSLAGRAGLDLGLTLSYNSLVWTKDAAAVTFDADEGFPSPGFRLGFPTVEPKFVNPQLQQAGQPVRYSYLLVTPSGARVELRQVGTTNVYESADSSYLQLSEADMTLSSTDGTRLSFVPLGGAYRCQQLKDRNGNYVSVSYYGDGRIWKVTDTLGRVLTFNYDNFQHLTSITQPWTREGEPGASPAPAPDEAHEWATFGYENRTLLPQFSGLSVIGDQPGTVFPAVKQLGLADGSFYRFAYNEWGQVWKVTHYAADSRDAGGQPNESHPLSSTRIDLPGSNLKTASPQADCPRFKEERVWVEYGVRNLSGEVTTSYDEWAPNMASCEATLPDGTTKQVSTYGASADGWKKGLTTKEEVFSGAQLVRTTTLAWEHDGAEAAPYQTNPRLTQTTISDPNPADPNQQPNVRTTRVTYTTAADFQINNGYASTLNLKLPKKVEECNAGCSTVMRTTVTDYSVPNLSQYVARRILGLARSQSIYEGVEAAGNLRALVTYLYDEPSDTQDTFLAAVPTPAAQHDGTNYGQAMTWRGNANRVRRYSVAQSNGTVGGYVESRAAFNVTGTAAYLKDALGHKTSVGYTDSFYQNVNRTHTDPAYRLQTYAYPTTIADPDNFTASTSYNYDLGVITEARTPKPNETTNLPGPLSHYYYDAAGRLVRNLSDANGAYTRVVYPAAMHIIESYTLVEAGKESRSVAVLDGAGKTRATTRYLPPTADNGTGAYPSNYNYSAQVFDYDEMGRVVRQTNPTEVSATWALAGDDTAWAYTSQTYDWKGRPLKTTHEADGSTFEYQYGGCGCAGGQTVSTRDEVGRRQKVTYDALGRPMKRQVFTQQDKSVQFTFGVNEAPYSTVTTTYNALDRATEVREHAQSTGAEQVTTTEYDGHGRVWRQRLPQYDANKFNTYAYNDDDTLASITDPRGAVTAYSYEGNNRHLVKSINSSLAGSATVGVNYEYDAAGNRTKMDDGPGWVTYEYDMLSRLLKEKRHFDDLGANTHNPYELNYTYTPSGKLKTLTDPFSSQFSYGYDRAGQLQEVKGSSYANVTTYASNVEYRAWGGVKSAAFGNGASQTTTYDSRMRPWQYRLTSQYDAYRLREDFTYYADGRLKRITDLDDGTRQTSPRYQTMSRAYIYDHVGRVTAAGGHAVTEPGGNGESPNWPSPFLQSYGYDGFGNMTSRTGTYGYQPSRSDTPNYVNNRRQGWTYDDAGHLTISTADANSGSANRIWAYDAAGRLVTTTETSSTGTSTTLTDTYDGDGRIVYNTAGTTESTFYMVRSSALGGEVVTRLTSAGEKGYTYVPAGGMVNARQTVNSSNQQVVEWTHLDPPGVTENGFGGLAAYDPLGSYAPLPPPPPQGQSMQSYGVYAPNYNWTPSSFTNANNLATGCTAASGSPSDCNSAMRRNMAQHPDFWDSMPHEYRGGEEMRRGEQDYQDGRDEDIYSVPIASSDGQYRLRLTWFGSSPVPGNQLGTTAPSTPQEFPSEVITAARDAISKLEPCQKLFQGKGYQDALERLDKLQKNNGILVSDVQLDTPKGKEALSSRPHVQAVVKDGKIYFNPAGKVLNFRNKEISDIFPFGGLSRSEALKILLIHELLHLTGDFGEDTHFINGNESGTESVVNSIDVRKFCLGKANPLRGITQ